MISPIIRAQGKNTIIYNKYISFCCCYWCCFVLLFNVLRNHNGDKAVTFFPMSSLLSDLISKICLYHLFAFFLLLFTVKFDYSTFFMVITLIQLLMDMKNIYTQTIFNGISRQNSKLLHSLNLIVLKGATVSQCSKLYRFLYFYLSKSIIFFM